MHRCLSLRLHVCEARNHSPNLLPSLPSLLLHRRWHLRHLACRPTAASMRLHTTCQTLGRPTSLTNRTKLAPQCIISRLAPQCIISASLGHLRFISRSGTPRAAPCQDGPWVTYSPPHHARTLSVYTRISSSSQSKQGKDASPSSCHKKDAGQRNAARLLCLTRTVLSQSIIHHSGRCHLATLPAALPALLPASASNCRPAATTAGTVLATSSGNSRSSRRTFLISLSSR